MREGSLEAPTRHKIDWQNPDFYDRAKIDAELHRVFDICHGCRRCFNLCDSFPRLFDLVDTSATGEVDGVATADYGKVVEACTLCDMCFMTKCPYVPPHPWAVDFPHLMLRARAADFREGKLSWSQRQLVETDRNGTLAGKVAPLANWASKTGNGLTRPVMEKLADIDRRAELPKFHGRSFTLGAKSTTPERDATAPGRNRKAVLYATCFVNYNNPRIGEAARAVLALQRRHHRGGLSPLLRHAASRAGRYRARRRARARGGGGARRLYRRRLRRGRADPVLRADAEIRMAADPAGGSRA